MTGDGSLEASDPIALSLDLARERKRLRYVHRVFCPRDQRLVAAIVVHEERLILWVVGGGRIASHGAMLAEFEELESGIIEDLGKALTVEQTEKLEASLPEVREAIAEIKQHRYAMIDEGMATLLEDHMPPVRHRVRTRCPGCKTRHWVRVDAARNTLELES